MEDICNRVLVIAEVKGVEGQCALFFLRIVPQRIVTEFFCSPALLPIFTPPVAVVVVVVVAAAVAAVVVAREFPWAAKNGALCRCRISGTPIQKADDETTTRDNTSTTTTTEQTDLGGNKKNENNGILSSSCSVFGRTQRLLLLVVVAISSVTVVALNSVLTRN